MASPPRIPHAWSGALLVAAVSLFASLHDLAAEKYNSDEGMWIDVSQRTWDLVRAGDFDAPAWASLDNSWGYVNPPVAKVALGMALAAQGVVWDREGVDAPPEEVLLAARRVSALLGVAGCVVLFGIGRQLMSLRAALLAGLLLAVSPFWLQVSRRVLTDAYGAVLSLLGVFALLAAIRALRAGRGTAAVFAWVLGAAGLTGLAVGAKLNAAPAGVFLGALLVVELVRALGQPSAHRTRDAGTVVALGVVFGAVSAGVFLASHPYLHEDAWARLSGILDYWRSSGEKQAEITAAGRFGHAFLPEEKGLSVLTGRLLWPVEWRAWLLAIPALLVAAGSRAAAGARRDVLALTGWLLLACGALALFRGASALMHPWITWIGLLGGAMSLAATRTDGDDAPALPLAVVAPLWFAVVALLVWKNLHLPYGRYYLPVLPPLLLVAGYGLAALRETLARTGIR
ncbi:glycosyltransferase family 39 protein, partial [bacterium]|nr:glycosyltransferase family 39 protein [bacterium]